MISLQSLQKRITSIGGAHTRTLAHNIFALGELRWWSAEELDDRKATGTLDFVKYFFSCICLNYTKMIIVKVVQLLSNNKIRIKIWLN
jgi:hypothetical protein